MRVGLKNDHGVPRVGPGGLLTLIFSIRVISQRLFTVRKKGEQSYLKTTIPKDDA